MQSEGPSSCTTWRNHTPSNQRKSWTRWSRERDSMANAALSTYDIAENEAVPQEGFNVIWARVFSHMLLKLANVPYRYRDFLCYGENKKPRLKISPEPEQEPP